MLEFDGTFLIAGLSFIIFTLLMNVILYKPMVRILGEREAFFDQNNTAVNSAVGKTKAIIEENNKKIATTQKNAQDLIKNSVENAKTQKAKKLKEAQCACDERLKDVAKNLCDEQKEAVAQLTEQMEHFVKGVASKVLGKQVQSVKLDESKVRELLEMGNV